jgi:hypothetical protein
MHFSTHQYLKEHYLGIKEKNIFKKMMWSELTACEMTTIPPRGQK